VALIEDHHYRGKGWQVPLLGILYVVGRGILESTFHPYVWASPLLSVLMAAAFGRWLWRRGRRLNANSPWREEWRRDQGFSLRRRPAHAYWLVPYEYWGIVFALLSILLDARMRARPIRPSRPAAAAEQRRDRRPASQAFDVAVPARAYRA
jgi:hypothetical protein